MSETNRRGELPALSERFGPDYKQQFAIRKISECAFKLAEMHPEIVTDADMTAEKLALKYEVEEMFGVSLDIAKRIVAGALKKLMPPEDIRNRQVAIQEAVRAENIASQKGIFGFSEEKRRERSAKGGEASKGVSGLRYKGGSATHDRKVGIFSYDHDKLREISLAGYKNRADSWVRVVVDGVDEGSFALTLSRNPEYIKQTGKYAGKPDLLKITEEVNKVYGNNRSPKKLREYLLSATGRKKRNR